MPLPTVYDIAGIIWNECRAIRDRENGRVVVTSSRTFDHRLALGITVANRGRQGMPWGIRPYNMPPRTPTTTEAADPDNRVAWAECTRAAHEAFHRMHTEVDIDSPRLHFGAQFYYHTHNSNESPRVVAGRSLRYINRFEVWDPRAWEENHILHVGRPLWLNIHIDDIEIRRASTRRRARARRPLSSSILLPALDFDTQRLRRS